MKEPLRLFRAQAGPGILHGHEDKLRSVRGSANPKNVWTIRNPIHCVESIDRQIHQQLLDLHAIYFDSWKIVREFGFQFSLAMQQFCLKEGRISRITSLRFSRCRIG